MERRRFITTMLGSGLAGSLTGCEAVVPWLSDRLESLRGELRALRVDHDICIGCGLCEAACHAVNHREGEASGRSRSLIRVHGFVPGPYHVAWACLGCPDRPCVRACDYSVDRPFGRRALDVDPRTGAVHLVRDACAGCRRCIEACERHGGAVLRWDDEELVTGACHLCGGRPACAAACPMGAIAVARVARGESLEARRPEAVARDGLARLRARGLGPEPLAEGGASLGALRVRHDLCTGCRLCEAACDERNGPGPDGGLGDPARSLIRIHPFPHHVYVAWACLGCAELPCVAACRAEAFGELAGRAMHLDPIVGAVRLAPEFCRRCRECVVACAARGGGVLRVSAAGLPEGVCHLCGGDPACAAACPEGAIELVAADRSCQPRVRTPAAAAAVVAERLFGGRDGGGA